MFKDNQLIIHELKKIGLSEKEARLYLTLLRKGPSSVQKLALTLKITRPTAYRLLDDLIDKGLARRAAVKDRAVKQFAAKAPDELLSLLRIKKRQVEEQERELLRMITELRATYHGDEGGITTYLNKEETRDLVIDDIITSSADEVFIWHNGTRALSAEKVKGLTATIHSKRGSVPIHEITSKGSANDSPLNFSGTVLVAHNVVILSESEIVVVTDTHVLALVATFLRSGLKK